MLSYPGDGNTSSSSFHFIFWLSRSAPIRVACEFACSASQAAVRRRKTHRHGRALLPQLSARTLPFSSRTCPTLGRGGAKPAGEDLAAFWTSEPWQLVCCHLPCPRAASKVRGNKCEESHGARNKCRSNLKLRLEVTGSDGYFLEILWGIQGETR